MDHSSEKHPADFLKLEMNKPQLPELQKSNNQLSATQLLIESKMQVPFALLLKHILPQLPNEIASQLRNLYHRLSNNEIPRESFLRVMKSIVGNQMLKEAVEKWLNRVSSRSSSVGLETKAIMPPKRLLDQEKPTEEYRTPLSLARKRQKISEIGSDESIEQLNDVTAIHGISLEEEEEMLFLGHKVGSRSTKSTSCSLRIVEGEEDGILFLQRSCLQGKLAQIISKCGINSMSKDVELCLSLSVEGRIRGLISSLLRMSRQRVDFVKTRHQISVTSDIHHQIVEMNQKDEERKKQEVEEAEKLQKLQNERDSWIFDENSAAQPDEGNSEQESNKDYRNCSSKTPKSGVETGSGGDIDKNADVSETSKASQARIMVDDTSPIAAANVAVRASVGGDDLMSKWKLMAEKAEQMGERFRAQVGEKMKSTPSQASGNMISYHQELQGGKNRLMPGAAISVTDVLAVLERDPQMSKSTYIYCLHERLKADAATLSINWR